MIRNEKVNKQIENNKFIFYLSYFFTVLVVCNIGFLLLSIPDSLNEELIRNTYIPNISNFVAERSEFITYVVLMVAFPLIFLYIQAVLKGFDINYTKFSVKKFNFCFKYFLVAIVTSLTFASFSYYIFYLGFNYVIALYIVAYLLIVFLLCMLLYGYINIKNINKILIGIVFLILLYSSSLYINDSFSFSRFIIHHFDAYYYPIIKIQSGLTPLIDFNSLYGNYSYIFAFILSFFSGNRILIFSIICALLVFISYGLLAYFSYKNINNKVLWFLIFCTFLFYNYIVGFTYGMPYLQYIPHRVIFPITMLCYSNYYINKRSDRIIFKIVGFLISSFALFWNLETGVVVLLTWFLLLGYEALYNNSFRELKFYKCFMRNILMLLLSILLYLLTVVIITYLRTSQIVGLDNLISGVMIFSGSGFYMVRMNFFSPWILLVFIYSIGLAISLFGLKSINKTNIKYKEGAIYFVLSILGMGIFSYYQGRSLPVVLLAIIYPGVILFGMLLDKLLINKKLNVLIFIVVILCVNTTTLFFSIFDSRIKDYRDQSFLDNNSMTYVDVVNKYKDIDFIVPYESWYYDKYNLEDKKTFPSYADLFKYSDIEQIIDYMYKCDKNVVMHVSVLRIIKEKYYEDYIKLLDKYDLERYDNRVFIYILKGEE